MVYLGVEDYLGALIGTYLGGGHSEFCLRRNYLFTLFIVPWYCNGTSLLFVDHLLTNPSLQS